MRGLGVIAVFLFSSAPAQIQVDVPIRSTGPTGERGISGIAAPTSEDSGLSVEVASTASVHWAVADAIDDTLVLSVSPPVSSYEDGILLRFNTPEGRSMAWMRVEGLSALPVVRMDGLQLAQSPLSSGTVAEVILYNEKWTLLNADRATCPVGSVRVTERLCMEVDPFPGLKIYQAIARCGDRGGKLCTWDEYVAGCSLVPDQLNGLFDEWEWIDDTSNHTHTADQVGRFTCQSQRTANAITLVVGDTRCCYHPR